MNSTLINFLKAETQELRTIGLENTKTSIEKEYKNALEILDRTTEDWCKIYNITPRVTTHWTGAKGYHEVSVFPESFYGTKTSIQHSKLMTSARTITWKGLEETIESALKVFNRKFDLAIVRLENRLRAHGKDDSPSIIRKGFRSGNFEMDMNYSGKRVSCYTIIAQGEIQRAHYRFLVKAYKS
jgi:hypothetical protein